nr:MAG TPA: hypothetical protein [Caudoviricetes sp.]
MSYVTQEPNSSPRLSSIITDGESNALSPCRLSD